MSDLELRARRRRGHGGASGAATGSGRRWSAAPETGDSELDRDVVRSLRRSFVVPDLAELIGRIEAAAAQMRGGGRDTIEGSIRWLAAAAALLFMFLTVCASTLMAPVEQRVEGPVMRDWSESLVHAVGLGLASASAAVAQGVVARRGGPGGFELRGFDTTVARPPGLEVLCSGPAAVADGGCSAAVAGPGDQQPWSLLATPRAVEPRRRAPAVQRVRGRCWQGRALAVLRRWAADGPGWRWLPDFRQPRAAAGHPAIA